MARKKPIPSSRMREDFNRKGPHKRLRDRILIVCEDGVISPKYFEEFCKDKDLTNTEVRVCGKECSNDPKSVYKFVKNEMQQDDKYERA